MIEAVQHPKNTRACGCQFFQGYFQHLIEIRPVKIDVRGSIAIDCLERPPELSRELISEFAICPRCSVAQIPIERRSEVTPARNHLCDEMIEQDALPEQLRCNDGDVVRRRLLETSKEISELSLPA